MTFTVRTGFNKENQCEEFAKVTITAKQAQQIIEQKLINGCTYKFGEAFALKYKGKALPIVPSQYKRRKCTKHR